MIEPSRWPLPNAWQLPGAAPMGLASSRSSIGMASDEQIQHLLWQTPSVQMVDNRPLHTAYHEVDSILHWKGEKVRRCRGDE